ncbi:2-phosphosulfolactate phosphatase [Desertibacillus haloalkaliphilus]|uniref:2-phosphosulfolactate phosphatase n=1 Tax=Desertibacillus haloalkaliphilus TaxID=1328930 RepID=UPI001C26577A|nr:2-phosphosulfolactate phosphatase [Desertibacillus haloalkaliphilus]MBU8906849.1 2-phosphosulfolactate phosphatase [Desertibacillus haloalkaliphilus]
MNITIVQGNDCQLPFADVNIVIDVIRAFTVSHLCFLQGVKEIWLAKDTKVAFSLKEKHKDFLLAGEINGLPIENFDLDNSPNNIITHDLTNKTIVQKTTNGVRATLNSLQAKDVIVTGFSNANTTASFIKNHIMPQNPTPTIHLVASHPSSDEDLACAEYINAILKGEDTPTEDTVIKRIKQAEAARKFHDRTQPDFSKEDLDYCTEVRSSSFIMKVNNNHETPKIERYNI